MDATAISRLTETLEKVAEKLQRHRDLYVRNEAAVRQQVIDPILRTLGWDTEDPNAVVPEGRSDVGSPDYTLMSGGRPILTIEVKNLGSDVAQPGALEQAHRYASAKGIPLCVATNGQMWLLARSFQEGTDLRGRILWQTLVSDQTIRDAVRRFSFIEYSRVRDIDQFVKLQDEVAEKWDELIEEPTDLIGSLVDLLRPRLDDMATRSPYEGFLEDFVDQRVREILCAQSRPTALSQTDADGHGGGDVSGGIRAGSAADILLAAGERAIREGRLASSDRIESGPARYLVSPEPVHKHARPFFSQRQLSNGLFIETHFSLSGARRQAELLDRHKVESGRRRR